MVLESQNALSGNKNTSFKNFVAEIAFRNARAILFCWEDVACDIFNALTCHPKRPRDAHSTYDLCIFGTIFKFKFDYRDSFLVDMDECNLVRK